MFVTGFFVGNFYIISYSQLFVKYFFEVFQKILSNTLFPKPNLLLFLLSVLSVPDSFIIISPFFEFVK